VSDDGTNDGGDGRDEARDRSIGLDYAVLHRIESPANRLIRRHIWGEEDDIGQQSFITPRYLDWLAFRLELGADDHVLDVGSGVGGPAVYLAHKTGCSVTGIDVSDVGVETARGLARRHGLEARVRFVLGDAMEMPFEDGTFTKAVSINVMNVFSDKVGLFREVRRALRPGGQWAFLTGTFDMPDDPETKRNMARGYLIPQYYDSLDSYREMLRKAGFVIDEITEYVSDFREQNKRWGEAYKRYYDEIAKEQGKENTDHHIRYFETYLRLIDEGRASNHLFISHKPHAPG